MLIQMIFTTYIVPYSQDLARSFLRTSTANIFENFIKLENLMIQSKG